MPRVRPPVLSGAWYPGETAELTRKVRDFMAAADPNQRPVGQPILAVVPHAGYAYSGATAGRLYGLLQSWEYERVFILAPSHRYPIRQIALPSHSSFGLPGGEVVVDQAVVTDLQHHPAYAILDDAHAAEHAVEIQLPFLRELWGEDLRIVPLLVPARDQAWLRDAAQALAPWCDGRSLFLVSSDFTHYGVAYGYVPFGQPTAEKLAELDQGAIDLILSHDGGGLLAYGEDTGITMCGIQAAAFALSAPLPVAGDAACVAYCRSGDHDGDYNLSVSYASLLISSPQLIPAERDLLLQLARTALSAAVAGRKRVDPERWLRDRGLEPSSHLQAKRGAFVTLTRDGRLRGCIGFIEGIKSLLATVVENAEAAAIRDPRFPPVQADELDDLHIEVSVLTPLTEIDDPACIVLGRDGIVMEKDNARAVFLPQVPGEQGWDLATTLDHLAMKAGLSPGDWKTDTRWQVFQAEVFDENPSV